MHLTALFPGIALEELDETSLIRPNAKNPVICSDESRIIQVLLNLQSNALKFTQKGSVKLVIEIVENQKEEKVLKVQVIDTGVGISEANQSKLFKFFGFVNDTKAINTKGVGLGLAISYQIVQQFGGHISMKSIVDKGSNFTFTMKLDEKSPLPSAIVSDFQHP